MFSLSLASCANSGSVNSLEQSEKEFCNKAVENEFTTTIYRDENGSILKNEDGTTNLYGVVTNAFGFTQKFATDNWFNLPEGDFQEIVKQYALINVFENKVEARNLTNAINAYCLGKYEIDISPTK
jgi:hypothetical protein